MNLNRLFLTLLIGIGFASCSSDKTNNPPETKPEGIPTYANISVSLPKKTRSLPEDYNPDGEYQGNDLIKTLDIYMQATAGGDIERKRFTGADISINNTTGTISPSQPFLTTSGYKTLYVVLNDTKDIGSTIIDETILIDIEGLAEIVNDNGEDKDVILMTGKGKIFIEPDVPMANVANGDNKFAVSVTRTASRVIVTTTATNAFDDGQGNTGTISDIKYSVAQGTKEVYWLQRADYTTYGYEYYPYDRVDGSVGYTGADNAIKYYDYSDLETPSDVPQRPAAGDGYKELPGKFLFENTHTYGATREDTEYRKGNTAYVLVRVTFTPDPASIADGNALTNNTFYVGSTDGKIYSSKTRAQEAVANQKVKTFRNGKMLYYAWLNPDVLDEPLNSPVIRNNIYHINITGFKNIGYNWNPLYPEDPDTETPQNPDPKPGPDEPDSPVDPLDPLTPEQTYMSVDVTVLEWTVHSYDIEF